MRDARLAGDPTWVFIDEVPHEQRLPPLPLPAGYVVPPSALQLTTPPPLVTQRAPSIELYGGRAMPPPEAMPRFSGWDANAAAQATTRAYGRLAGTVCTAVRVPGGAEALRRLTAAHTVVGGGAWDADGECAAPAGTVSLTRLLRWLDAGQAELVPGAPERGTLAVLEALYSLQSPSASHWRRPFVRVVGSLVGVSTAADGGVLIEWLVYVGRLLFELVADESIRTFMQALTPASRWTPPAPLPVYPPCFVSTVRHPSALRRTIRALTRTTTALATAACACRL
jgi:hypothetical protein